MNEFEKVTPDTYKEMNEEFIHDGTSVRIEIPTEAGLERWKNWKEDIHTKSVPPTDMVAEMWEKHREHRDK